MTGSFIRTIFSILFVTYFKLFALDISTTVLPNDVEYFKHKVAKSNVELIYSKNNLSFAKHTASIENSLQEEYQKTFQWNLDEKLYVGLISSHNERSNGFSTQWPNNRQINYLGGVDELDYFCTLSWLDFLLYHETAHNYQVNVKANSVSRTLHSIFGNGLLFLPTYFTVPGSAAHSFMLEGNAVLNESWHGNGGRLYSGRLKAMNIIQAQAGILRAEYMYNDRVKFPYKGVADYEIGGFYNLYMAEKYGLHKINAYFLEKTKDWWWPFYTNDSMKRTLGVNFENSLENFSNKYKKMAKKFIFVQGKKIAGSQFYTGLSSDKSEIYFISNETGVSKPELIIINKKSSLVHKEKASWLAAKVIKKDAHYYTQANNYISTTKIKEGLFDKNAFIKKETESKVIQAYLSDGRAVYFDVQSSYTTPKLYIGENFYAQINSSVIIDSHDNIYYFVNKGKKRTLYKNKQALYTYEGFYGIVADVSSSGSVYFIANSALGSSLYRYKNGIVSRASRADNIVEARLFNDKEVLLSAIGKNEYYYVKNNLVTISQTPYETELFFEKKSYYGAIKKTNKKNSVNILQKYESLQEMHYSGSDFSFSLLNNNNFMGNLKIKFADPLTQNSLDAYLISDEFETLLTGITYTNHKNILAYSMSAYNVLQKSSILRKTKEWGFMASLSLPLYKAGYYSLNTSLEYYEDYTTLSRDLLSMTLAFSRSEQYGVSMYKNYKNSLKIYGVSHSTDKMYGMSYSFMRELGKEFYLQIDAKFSKSSANITQTNANISTRGVKISPLFYQVDKDVSTIVMPSVANYIYTNSVAYGGFGISKVFNLSSYFFTFPFSLQREAVYLKYRHYGVETFIKNANYEKVNEYMFGVRLDTVFLNILSKFSLSFDFYYNDNKKFSKDNKKMLFNFGTTF